MCRFLVYKGSDEILLSKLILDPTHSILKQSFDSRLRLDTRRGQNNADGFGIGFYTDARLGLAPCLFTSTTPAWSCQNLGRIASKTASRLVFAHVRATTEGSLSEENCHPFHYGSLMWMHNGGLGGWRHIKRRLSERLADRWYLGVHGNTDSEWAFALFLDTLERMGHDPASGGAGAGGRGFGPTVLRRALLRTIRLINELTDQIPESVIQAEAVDTRSLLNFAVTDGHSVVCTRYISSATDEAASLYYSSGTQWETLTEAADDRQYQMERRDKGADIVLVASEPLTFEREHWVNVPTNSVLTIHKQTVMVHPIMDEYRDRNPYHARSSTFVQTKGLATNEKSAAPPAQYPIAAGMPVPDDQQQQPHGRGYDHRQQQQQQRGRRHEKVPSGEMPSAATPGPGIILQSRRPSIPLSPAAPPALQPLQTLQVPQVAAMALQSATPRHPPAEGNISRKRAAPPVVVAASQPDSDPAPQSPTGTINTMEEEEGALRSPSAKVSRFYFPELGQ